MRTPWQLPSNNCPTSCVVLLTLEKPWSSLKSLPRKTRKMLPCMSSLPVSPSSWRSLTSAFSTTKRQLKSTPHRPTRTSVTLALPTTAWASKRTTPNTLIRPLPTARSLCNRILNTPTLWSTWAWSTSFKTKSKMLIKCLRKLTSVILRTPELSST